MVSFLGIRIGAKAQNNAFGVTLNLQGMVRRPPQIAKRPPPPGHHELV